jgi:hypothetical protein
LDAEVEINSSWETIRENIKNFSKRDSRLIWIEEAEAMVQRRMLRIDRSEETS